MSDPGIEARKGAQLDAVAVLVDCTLTIRRIRQRIIQVQDRSGLCRLTQPIFEELALLEQNISKAQGAVQEIKP